MYWFSIWEVELSMSRCYELCYTEAGIEVESLNESIDFRIQI